ncbi:MAG TPA: 3-deoxy-D-arabino-heptulosonate 7-phosphate synthase [Burkholderiaceae bacterium]|nr:3-deoxy-D-arabino-heptulosonate 7-phosphate synthase [Burkholderiaceae bacterium]
MSELPGSRNVTGLSVSEGEHLLAKILSEVPRRYRLDDLPEVSDGNGDPLHCANQLAVVMEHARRALAEGQQPGPQLKQRFLHCLETLLRDAMQPEGGDPTFQALVLRHQSEVVQEYVALAVQQAQDTRRLHALLNAFAHPAKLARMPVSEPRKRLEALQEHAAQARWSQTASLVSELLSKTEDGFWGELDPAVHTGLHRMQQDASLLRLQRLEVLTREPEVQRYQALWERQGPPANSHAAAQNGAEGRLRGNNVETLTKEALQALADFLNARVEGSPYRVVTAMYVPAALAAHQEGGKTEWDAVLLRRVAEADPHEGAESALTDDAALWEVSLLVEAKASPDSVATDFPRLLRGLKVLAQADEHRNYPFKAREGIFLLRGAQLARLPTEVETLDNMVLYTSDAPADRNPRLLSAAARMQLMSSPEGIAYATAVSGGGTGDAHGLDALWTQLLHAPQWTPILQQYHTISQARALMVHVDDLAPPQPVL